MELPKQLKANRERLGMSQEEVAHAIYVSRQTMSSWENGKTYPDVQSLLLLSNLFGVSVDELLKGDVAAMQSNVSKDAQTIKHLGWAMSASIGFEIVFGIIAIVLRDVGIQTPYGMSIASFVLLLVMGALFLCTFACAVWAEVLKKQNNIVTYREIIAFTKGESVEDIRNEETFSRKHPVISIIAKVYIGALAAFGLFVLYISFTVVGKTIRDLIFMSAS